MYGLPQNVNLAFFAGRTLLQVCIGAHDLILNFDGNVSVTVTSSVGCIGPDGAIQQYVNFRLAAPAVLDLLNHVIVSAEGDQEGTLTLKFQDGGTLSIYDDSKEYESYIIRSNEQVIVV